MKSIENLRIKLLFFIIEVREAEIQHRNAKDFELALKVRSISLQSVITKVSHITVTLNLKIFA